METFSRDFSKAFLFTLTRELIRNSAKDDITELKKIFKSEEKNDIIELQKIVESEEKEEPIIKIEKEPAIKFEGKEPVFEPSILSKEEIMEIERPIQVKQITRKFVTKPILKQVTKIKPRTHLFIPELKLPPHLEYLKPIPAPGIDIDLFKLNPVIKDPAVRLIEVNPNEKVIVTGKMGTKPTDIILSGEEIMEVINKFSEFSRIPINEGIYRVVAGNLILSAIISETTDSKFVIKKMVYPNSYNMQSYPSSPNRYY
jgi:hypothetical protein